MYAADASSLAAALQDILALISALHAAVAANTPCQAGVVGVAQACGL
jgi:hypothetical protein